MSDIFSALLGLPSANAMERNPHLATLIKEIPPGIDKSTLKVGMIVAVSANKVTMVKVNSGFLYEVIGVLPGQFSGYVIYPKMKPGTPIESRVQIFQLHEYEVYDAKEYYEGIVAFVEREQKEADRAKADQILGTNSTQVTIDETSKVSGTSLHEGSDQREGHSVWVPGKKSS